MAWRPPKGSIHQTRKFLEDYPAIAALREKYPTGNYSLSKLKKACLKDGYEKGQVDKMKLRETEEIDPWPYIVPVKPPYGFGHSLMYSTASLAKSGAIICSIDDSIDEPETGDSEDVVVVEDTKENEDSAEEE
tara:strand:+ start:972 stop:1370 length:399 start_codon:yes stop_codon:yes gene_type:complete